MCDALRNDRFRRLPSVHSLASHPDLADFRRSRGWEAVAAAARDALSEARRELAETEGAVVDVDSLALRAVGVLVAAGRPALRRVLNATGILLNTGLGRAPLAADAADAVDRVVRGYCNLEYDLDSGGRGGRADAVESLLVKLTGAEAAAVVNNNAGATLLCLRALAAGREVVISRGQLVEIGGGFRLPEILEASGARLREVGTTNKTRIADYARALNSETAALLRVHPSNFKIVGFAQEVPIAEMVELAHANGLLAIDDIGSGALSPGRPPGLRSEPTAAESIAAGADAVLFSGDKLLGGPQCGVVVGGRGTILRLREDPLMRALRVDKMVLAALEATLRLQSDPASAARRIPLWALLAAPVEEVYDRAVRMAASFRERGGLDVEVATADAYLGGGSAPFQAIPTAVVRVGPPFPAPWASEAEWARALRLGDPAVVARVQGGRLIFDLRTLTEAEDLLLKEAVLRSVALASSDEPGLPR